LTSFLFSFRNFNGGSEWLPHYRKEPLLQKIWRDDYIGQEHVVRSHETHFVEIPPIAQRLRGERYAVKRNSSAEIAFPEFREAGPMNITIRAESVEPRAFQLDNFLSEVEVDHIIDVVCCCYCLQHSTTGEIGVKAQKQADVSDTSV
jgi:hypothetical protein